MTRTIRLSCRASIPIPPALWVKGVTGLLTRRTVAVVGARNASALGLRTARRLARELGTTGHVIVSGLARGIDAAAHEATLASGTIAVMAGGLDRPYPPGEMSDWPSRSPTRACWLQRSRSASRRSLNISHVETALSLASRGASS